MLSSIKLKMTLFWLSCFFSQTLLAADPRYYLILRVMGIGSYPYVGSLTVNDDIQALVAQVFFPGGHTVVIEMDIQLDGHTVDLQISAAGQIFQVAPLTEQLTSPIALAVQAGAGNPSGWFATPDPVTYQFQLPVIEPQHRIRLDKQVKNSVGGISLRFNRHKGAEVPNMGYRQGEIMFNPGTGTSDRSEGTWQQMTDAGLLQLMELLVVALISPQLVRGNHFSTMQKRDKADANQRVSLCINRTQRGACVKESAALQGGLQGYSLLIQEAFGWVPQFIAGPMPADFSPAGGYGVINVQGRQKACFIQPCFNPAVSGVDPTVAHLMHQFAGMNVGTPPQNCRDGWGRWHYRGGYGGGPGSGRGGGSGGFRTR